MTQRLWLFVAAVAALIPLLALAAWLWRRFYRDDPANTARRVLKNSAVPTAVRLLVRAIDMAFALVLFRLLAPNAIGQYDLAALLVVQYLGTFADFGLGVLLTREVARQPADAPRYFGATLALRLGLALLALPLAALVIGGYAGVAALLPGSRGLTTAGTAAILILCLTLFPAAYTSAVTAVLNARERLEIPAAVELITQVISVLARVAVLLAGFGVIGLAWAAVGTTLVTALIFIPIQRRLLFPVRLAWSWAFARSLLRPAAPLMFNNLLINAAFSFDTFILRAFADDNTVAQYRMPYRVLSVALILPPMVTGAIFPVLARSAQTDRALFARTYRLALSALLLVAFPVAAAVTLLAPQLVQLFAGGEAGRYLGISDRALAILIWFLPLSYINGVTQYVLIALDRQSWITRAFGAMALFNLIGNLVLIPRFGIDAASVLTVASEAVLLALFLPELRRAEVLPPLAALAWRPALAAACMGAALLLLLPLGLGWFAAACLTLPVYAVAIWLLGAVGPEERALLRRALGR